MKQTIIGTLAHVDAGKTTLSESMLYLCGSIRKLGRVDHKDAFLDFDNQERNRGITIFSKQAVIKWKDTEITMIDTPGHVDFSAEMERTLQVLDYAVLIISGLDGVQAHTETIWNLLKHYHIPTFLFVNKMDISHYEQRQLMIDLENKLDFRCVDFTLTADEKLEKISLCDESLLEYYIEHMTIEKDMLVQAIAQRKVFPCYFGSALKVSNVDLLMDGLDEYTENKQYPKTFGAKVYKISRDEQGNKLTHMKITGGSLKVKACLHEGEKVDQIRKYSGLKYRLFDEVYAGTICAVKGLRNIFLGEGLGMEANSQQPLLSSHMSYRVILPERCDVNTALKNLQQLSQEDPQLHVHYQEQSGEISIQLMGEIQIEILRNVVKERFNTEIDFDQGSVVYKETITNPVEGIGHYEPLRHYAEVHLLLKPGKAGSGIQIDSTCPEDVLSRNWQRLILSHIEEKDHIGVLTGSRITDIKITLLVGKAHLKHTEGGDFRQATYRAIRQGLKSTTSILLEPYYHFRLEIPATYLSKAIYDVEAMHANFSISENGYVSIISGSVPIVKMQNYQNKVMTYTKGKGKLFCTFKGYEPCENANEIITALNYDSERDVDHPTGSIFCSKGSGYYVNWDEVDKHMHIKKYWNDKVETGERKLAHNPVKIDDEEMERIMFRTYGANTSKLRNKNSEINDNRDKITFVKRPPKCLLVDGYNIIHSWENLKTIAMDNLDAAREKLIDCMSSYQGFKKCLLLLVFDAYKVTNGTGTTYYNGSIHIIYTKKAQTADAYIERTTHELSNQYDVSVATSDGLEQLIVSGQGAKRMSAKELKQEVEFLSKQRIQAYEHENRKGYVRPLEQLRKMNEEK